MKAKFIDRKGFFAHFDVPSPPPREWRVAIPIHISRFIVKWEGSLTEPPLPNWERDVIDFELYEFEKKLPIYREKI